MIGQYKRDSCGNVYLHILGRDGLTVMGCAIAKRRMGSVYETELDWTEVLNGVIPRANSRHTSWQHVASDITPHHTSPGNYRPHLMTAR